MTSTASNIATPPQTRYDVAVFIARFWKQPNKSYRNFQIVFTLLTLNFLFPALTYLVAPSMARDSIVSLGRLLGAPDYPVSEESLVWRVLAGTNVLTLAFTCFLLQLNVRRFFAALYPLVFMKATTAIAYLATYFVALAYPLFWAIFLWDGLAVFLFIFFATRARRTLATSHDDASLIPRLAFNSSAPPERGRP
ncbi:MAG: hypothetical protein HYY84_13170 [Deltaproteobacteria bacterium]|nr:hypothetical protein [Deltaproteobacteria bacterium]